jgi:hypothetical protein
MEIYDLGLQLQPTWGLLRHFLRHFTPLLVCSFEMCAGVPTIEMKIFHGLLVRYNTRLCCIPTMVFDSGESNVPSIIFIIAGQILIKN